MKKVKVAVFHVLILTAKFVKIALECASHVLLGIISLKLKKLNVFRALSMVVQFVVGHLIV